MTLSFNHVRSAAPKPIENGAVIDGASEVLKKKRRKKPKKKKAVVEDSDDSDGE